MHNYVIINNIKEKHYNFVMEFIVDDTYLFKGHTYLIENINKQVDENITPFTLGKFIQYIPTPYWGTIYDKGKALFENGIVSENNYQFISSS
jgi:hypothetical protein